MWRFPGTYLWPFYGWSFPKGDLEGWFWQWVESLLTDTLGLLPGDNRRVYSPMLFWEVGLSKADRKICGHRKNRTARRKVRAGKKRRPSCVISSPSAPDANKMTLRSKAMKRSCSQNVPLAKYSLREEATSGSRLLRNWAGARSRDNPEVIFRKAGVLSPAFVICLGKEAILYAPNLASLRVPPGPVHRQPPRGSRRPASRSLPHGRLRQRRATPGCAVRPVNTTGFLEDSLISFC